VPSFVEGSWARGMTNSLSPLTSVRYQSSCCVNLLAHPVFDVLHPTAPSSSFPSFTCHVGCLELYLMSTEKRSLVGQLLGVHCTPLIKLLGAHAPCPPPEVYACVLINKLLTVVKYSHRWYTATLDSRFYFQCFP